jgi:tRNA(Ile)-lysidine synthase
MPSLVTVANVRERVQAGGLLLPGSVVVAMLSGGRDSVCLLDVCVELLGREKVRALHVNYGLRAESEGDELYCRELCKQVGVEIEVVRAGGGREVSGNLHAWARGVRYGAAMELAEAHDALVASGHTATDQVETILYRLAASPGRRALLGMPARDGRLIRPLLGATREQTQAYCRERRLRWREDASNEDEQYARTRVRKALVPALNDVHPAAQLNVVRTAELLREETQLLDGLVDAELSGRSSIAIERLEVLQPALQRLIVIRLAEGAASTFVPQAGERVAEILELAQRGGPAELHVGGLVGAIIEDGELYMVRIPGRGPNAKRVNM